MQDLTLLFPLWPLAYYLVHKWLQEFAYRIPLGVGYFIIGGSISLGIAALVMSYQVTRAAIANPVDSLRLLNSFQLTAF